ncbi:MAG: endonuclease/exonuclease/phosphatase family protein [Gemmatimonadota bacterium]
MSFNIRYGTADDGENAWPHRREFVTSTIRRFGPDLLGVQEALRFQLDELGAALSEYRELGVGRDDGREAGEYAAILFRAERFEPLYSGTFWLSDRPETPGSATWGNRIPRICTWATLRDLRSGVEILVMNAHLDHESAPSRERAVALIAARAANLRGQRAVILMGDFNTRPASPPMAWLRGDALAPWKPAGSDSTPATGAAAGLAAPVASDPSPGFRDAFAVAHPDSVDPGTYHGFTGEATGGRIDAILVSDAWVVREAGILRAAQAGRFPSDHFPVTAVLRPRR